MLWMRSFSMVLVIVSGFAGHALAATGWISYSPTSFAEAQAAGKTILVDVAADWCPVCKAQHPILDELSVDSSLKDVLFVRVDFDTQKAFLKEHRIPRQSTIVIFKGEMEIDRSIAVTNRDQLRNFVFNALRQ